MDIQKEKLYEDVQGLVTDDEIISEVRTMPFTWSLSDGEIVKAVRSSVKTLTEIETSILKKRLHEAIMEKITEAVLNNAIKISSVEDFDTLVRLDLLLGNSLCK